MIVHDEEEEEERRKIFIHASSGGGIATSFAPPRRLTHERSTSTSYILFSLSLSPKVLFLCACTFFDAKMCHFLCLLLFFATIPRSIVFIINGIVAHDAGKKSNTQNTFIITMVDYSKWDKLDYGDESEDDGEDDKNVPHFPQQPQVTKLDQPTRVTIGSGESVDFNVLPPSATSSEDNHLSKDEKMMSEREFREMQWIEQGKQFEREHPGTIMFREPPSSSKEEEEEKEKEEEKHETKTTSLFSEEEKEERRRVAIARRKEKFTRNGIYVRKKSSRGTEENENSAGELDYMWSQTSSDVTLSVLAPLGTKAKDVRVDVTETSVKIALCKEVVFDREWEHPIGEEVEEYDEEEEYNANGGLKFNESDKSFTPIRRKLTYGSWEVTDYDENNRVIRVTAQKKSVELMRHWWQKCLKDEENHGEMLKLPDRSASAKSYDSKKVWMTLHADFKAQVKNRELIDVEVGK